MIIGILAFFAFIPMGLALILAVTFGAVGTPIWFGLTPLTAKVGEAIAAAPGR